LKEQKNERNRRKESVGRSQEMRGMERAIKVSLHQNTIIEVRVDDNIFIF